MLSVFSHSSCEYTLTNEIRCTCKLSLIRDNIVLPDSQCSDLKQNVKVRNANEVKKPTPIFSSLSKTI